ncbi:MAG: TrkH family potassium uptake protein [Armatimonadota bacterium]|nr:TrkH family potassium uptake protein [Armatimonadota bacterium]MDR5702693.1 TrkH family potassium uptake protein [Armatimonadota bacterium]MDR7433802.1 TrkH family potassium uptake protein [Armatimonadota bacterium]
MAKVLHFPVREAYRRLELNPAQTIVLGFALTVFIGVVLLSLPFSTADGKGAPLLTALFTATSATCVTGLVVVDTADYYSLFGELVVLLLIQVGGLGYMTSATLFSILVGKRIGLRERIILMEAYNLDTLGGVVRLTRNIVLMALAFEGIGVVLLSLRWIPEFGVWRGLYYSLFHAVSAFNNAGFDLMGNFRSFTQYVVDPYVNLVVSALIIAGGLGFIVLINLPRFPRVNLHAKVVLTTSAALIGVGTLSIFLLEGKNPLTLGKLPPAGKLLAAFFQSVTPRTAGFSTLDIAHFREPTLLLLSVLMFIGASPGGTGGGIKTTTFAVLLAAIWTMIRGRQDVEIYNRRVPSVVIYKALTIALVAVALVVTMTILLATLERSKVVPALFEVTSAFGTVGLTTGITPRLTAAGKVLLIVTMFLGRVGLLTFTLAFMRRQAPMRYRYPEERVLVG